MVLKVKKSFRIFQKFCLLNGPLLMKFNCILTQYSLYSVYDLDHYMNYILFVGDRDIASMFVPRVYLVDNSSNDDLTSSVWGTGIL